MLGGKNVDLLGRAPQALYAVIGVIAWQYTPFYMVYFLAGYSNISTDIYEATIIDGATRGQYFRHVALPMLSPVIRTACILSLIGSLKYFDLIYVMTGGGPGTATELMATYMYKLSFQHFQMGYGSTAAAGMFILVTSIALIIQSLIKERGEV
jgi:raffinose/stachyose/melibiose transport system permease protein